MLIDTHCHLNFADAFPEPDEAIDEASENDVKWLIAIGCDLETSARAIELAERREEVYATVGIHPNYSAAYAQGWLDEIRSMLSSPKAVAIGEIGLDFHWEYATREQQEAALNDQLALAEEMKKPIVFHCRDAYGALLDLLENTTTDLTSGLLFHCFSGTAKEAERALALGGYFGVDGPITYKSAGALRELFAWLPADRIVIETDSPYMTPVPHRGKPNRPAYVRFVNNGLAACRGISTQECAQITSRNAQRFFGLPAAGG